MRILKVNQKNLKEVIETALQLIKEGKVIICPTDTVYGLICDATNMKAVKGLLKIKRRPKNKPIPIFVKNLKMAKKFAKIGKNQEKILKEVWPGKVIAVLKVKGRFPKGIVCQRGKIGLRIPKYKLLNKILNKFKGPLAQTSANLTGKLTPAAIEDILNQFENKKYQPDMAIDAGRLSGKPSKVIDLTAQPFKVLRQ